IILVRRLITRDARRDVKTQETLARLGIQPFSIQTIEQDAYRKRSIYSALLLENNQRFDVVTPLIPGSENQVEFFIDTSLQRRQGVSHPRLSLIAEHPLLPPAEALMEYAQWQQPIPQAPDVYSTVRDVLSSYGFQIQTISPKDAKPEVEHLPVKLPPG